MAVVCTGMLFHLCVYDPLPPEVKAVAVPLHNPLQVILVLVAAAVTADGSVIVTVAVELQELPSTMLTV
jgi:hypothetical protein